MTLRQVAWLSGSCVCRRDQLGAVWPGQRRSSSRRGRWPVRVLKVPVLVMWRCRPAGGRTLPRPV